MIITYIHHSCFLVETKSCAMIFDYYTDDGSLGEIISKLDKPLYVFSSHFHGDHFSPQIFKWRGNKADIKYILSRDILEEGMAQEKDGFFIEKSDIWQDENIRVKAYGSTDAGISFYVEADGFKIFHAGDLNNWHWADEAEEEESKGYETAYHKELAEISGEIKELDILMFPVDKRLGTDYYKGAEEFIEKIETRAFVPMHFWKDYESANAFKAVAMKYCKEFFTINKSYEKMEWGE